MGPRSAIALFFLLLSGCSAYRLAKMEPPPLRPFGARPAGLAQICVMRPREGGSTSPVRDNGKLVGATRSASYFCYFARAGRHDLTLVPQGPPAAVVEAVSGERYYLEQVPDGRLVPVPEKAARPLAERCTYHVLSRVPGSEQLPGSSLVAESLP